jgi:predicted lipoprotein with Yx(FWY)xxD motif
MRHSSLLTASLATALLLLTAACGSSDPAAAPAASSPASAGVAVTSPATPSAVTALKTATTALGEVVTDGDGRTLYMFSTDGKDATQSACTGACLRAWPPALMGSTAPSINGVTGTIGSIPAPGGGRQLTLGGWPLYYYAKDAAVGDTKGQAVGNVWWVLDGSGSAVMGSSSGGGY